MFIYTRDGGVHRGTATASWSGAVRVRRLTQTPPHSQLGGAGDRTSNLQVTSQPPLLPELLLPSHVERA